MKYLYLLLFFGITACNSGPQSTETNDPLEAYENLKKEMLSGWNTWDNRSILTHVHLPEGLALIVKLDNRSSREILEHAFTGNRVPGSEKVETRAHTGDGSYSDFILHWRNFDIRVQTASTEEDLYIRIIDIGEESPDNEYIQIKHEFIYGDEGTTGIIGNDLSAVSANSRFSSYFLTPGSEILSLKTISLALKDTLYIVSGKRLNERSIDKIMEDKEAEWKESLSRYGEYSESYNAIRNAMNWTVVYDPLNERAVIPVSRPWSYGWGNSGPGGWVQFCWDNFFVAYMQAMDNKDLAFNEAIQMCNYIDELGFVPNFAGPGGLRSRDRSQPPVGSIMIKEIYKMHPEKWFLEKTFDQLLNWNRWWSENRDQDGLLAWGSNPAASPSGDKRELLQNNFKAASFESGLDNTPMHDGVEFDTTIHMLKIVDVGLTSMYIADCDALAEMALEIGRENEAAELTGRAGFYRANLKTLWDEETGLFLNKHTDTGELSKRISPTNFHPLLAKAATQEQAERMIKEHFYNPDEFWGEWIMPSISRNDTAYTGQDYWRGSIWAPMNFLVYLGFRNYDLPDARKDLSRKSYELLMKEWLERGYIRENYQAETGGAPPYRSEHFYHWGALLGMINMIEEGFVPPTEKAISEILGNN